MRDWIGQRVGRYQVIRLLDHGTMIDWYLGSDVIVQRHITLLLAAPTDEDGLFRFERNLPISRYLHHPHIAPMLDAGVEDRTPFVALAHFPTSRQAHPFPLPLPTVVRYVSQLAEALHYAHGHGVWHTYTTPETILIGSRGDALLAGFGVRLLEISSSQERLGWEFPVPPASLAPEQVIGWKMTNALDQYGLAAVAYEWLCGARLFHGAEPLTIVRQVLQDKPPSLQEQVLSLPPLIEEVIMTALAKKPEERFASIQAFSQAFREASKSADDGPTRLP